LIAFYLAARRGTYDISQYGGVWKKMPVFAAFFLIVTLSAIALPGTSGFTGEFLMLIGAFGSNPWAVGIATTSAIWSAVYMLWMFQRVMHGPIKFPEVEAFKEIGFHEKTGLAVICVLIIIIGVAPSFLLNTVSTPTTSILASMQLPARPVSPLKAVESSQASISLKSKQVAFTIPSSKSTITVHSDVR
jgi:NADH-quinone oxidoreductase subunit M